MQRAQTAARRAKPFNRLTNDTLSAFDWVIFSILAFVCFFTFQYSDLLHTGGASINWLTGHALDAYDQYADMFYMPTTYWLFALWNIPLRVLGVMTEASAEAPYAAVMWYKALPTLFYLASGYLIYDLGLLLDMGERKAKIAAYVFLTAPIAFFSQFLFGQYDIFTVFFVLLGMRAWLKRQNLRFTLFFGVALTLKYFSVTIFLLLLFLREKDIRKMFGHGLLLATPFALELALYIHSPAFRANIFGFAGDKGNYLFLAGFSLGDYTALYIIVPLYILLCGLAYCTTPDSPRAEGQWMLYLGSLSMFLLFGLSMFHPQWLLFAVPFMTLSTMLHKRSDGFLFLDLVMYAAYLLFTVNVWPMRLDHYLFKYGFFYALFNTAQNDSLLMCDLFPVHSSALFYSVLSGLLLVNAVFKHPRYLDDDPARFDKSQRWILRVRFIAAVLAFVLPASYCFYASNRQPAPFFSESSIESVTDELVDGDELAQLFVADSDSLGRVDIRVATYMRVNTSRLTLRLTDCESGDEMLAVSADCSEMPDNSFVSYTFEPISLIEGRQYRLSVTSDAEKGNGVCIYHDDGYQCDDKTYALYNSQKMPYNYCVRLYAAESVAS